MKLKCKSRPNYGYADFNDSSCESEGKNIQFHITNFFKKHKSVRRIGQQHQDFFVAVSQLDDC